MVTNMFEKYDNIPENYTPNNFKRLLYTISVDETLRRSFVVCTS